MAQSPSEPLPAYTSRSASSQMSRRPALDGPADTTVPLLPLTHRLVDSVSSTARSHDSAKEARADEPGKPWKLGEPGRPATAMKRLKWFRTAMKRLKRLKWFKDSVKGLERRRKSKRLRESKAGSCCGEISRVLATELFLLYQRWGEDRNLATRKTTPCAFGCPRPAQLSAQVLHYR